MTCHDARELLSALLDDALGPAERAALEAHVAACADCSRELEALRATVALLGRLPAAHAPVGFVDRVVAAAYRPPWPRRVLDALFVPLRVKLPLEAVAVLLVSVSALYLYQRTPEVQEFSRQAAREASPVAPPTTSPAPPPGPAAPEIAGQPPAAKAPAAERKRAPAAPPAAREQTRQAPSEAASGPVPSAALPDLRATPAAPPAVGPQQKAKEETEAQGTRVEERADALKKRSAVEPEPVAKANEPTASRDAAGAGSRVSPPTPLAGAAAKPPPAVPAPAPRGGEGGAAPAHHRWRPARARPATPPRPRRRPSRAGSCARSTPADASPCRRESRPRRRSTRCWGAWGLAAWSGAWRATGAWSSSTCSCPARATAS